MCGRYASPDTASIERQWLLRSHGVAALPQRFNVAPAAEVPVLGLRDGALGLAAARWAFVPQWWKQAKPPRLSHIARIEEAAGKPMWRDAMKRSRCLIPAAGWYEWREEDRQPFYFFRRDGRLAAFAGLYSARRDASGAMTVTCALLTTAATGALAAVHDRMPVMLDGDGERAWLEAGEAAAAPGGVGFHPVRRLVNAARSEGPELIEPLAA